MTLQIISILTITIYILIKDIIIPKRNNGKVGNPITLPVFYERFTTFKDTQEKRNEKIDKLLEKIDGRVNKIEGGK